MKIVKDPKLLESLLERAREREAREREGLHLTDLLYPRQAFWKRTKPKPVTMAEMLFFIAGRGVEQEFLEATQLAKAQVEEWNGIYYTVDTRISNCPTEIKSRRRYLAEDGKEAEVYDNYLRQLKCYCAMEGSTIGFLPIISLMEKVDDKKTEPVLVTYRVEFTEAELGEALNNLTTMKTLLTQVLEAPNPNHQVLPQCPQWMCGRVLRNMVVLPKCEVCGQEFKTEYGAKKHSEGKKTKGHTIIPPQYEYDFEKRCKWFDECEPQMEK